MQLSTTVLYELTELAMSAARRAGEITNKFSRDALQINDKNCGSSAASKVVTQVDYLCQEAILDTLHPSLSRYNIACLTEESADDGSRLEKPFFWCIDPLDGTLPFTESMPGYANSIALVSRTGAPLLGVIYDPQTQTIYHAIKSLGAFRNTQPWSYASIAITQADCFTFINDRSFEQHHHAQHILAKMQEMSTKMGLPDFRTRLRGGAVMNACWALENAPACYFKFPKKNEGGGSSWDYAAVACLYQEMGAVASDIYGQPLDLNRPDSTFMNHRGVIFTHNQEVASYIQYLYITLTTGVKD